MIPKIIHYCWFGGKPMPKLESRCMESWQRMLPDYKVMRWDESNFDVYAHPFTASAYKAKKYAFVADYVRLYALMQYGGVYLDTDVEILKSFDDLLELEAFGGFETPEVLQTGVLGMCKDTPVLREYFDIYQHIPYEVDEKGNNLTPANSSILTQLLSKYGLRLDNSRQSINGMELFPQEYFCPIDQATREIVVTPSTYTVHYLSGSWFPMRAKMKNALKKRIGKIFGFGVIRFVRRIIVRQS